MNVYLFCFFIVWSFQDSSRLLPFDFIPSEPFTARKKLESFVVSGGVNCALDPIHSARRDATRQHCRVSRCKLGVSQSPASVGCE